MEELEKTLSALKVFYRRVNPEEIPWILTGSTSLILQGVDVPIKDDMGDFQYKRPDGSWSAIRKPGDGMAMEIDGMNLRVLPLAEELKEYEAMGRSDKAAAIRLKLGV